MSRPRNVGLGNPNINGHATSNAGTRLQIPGIFCVSIGASAACGKPRGSGGCWKILNQTYPFHFITTTALPGFGGKQNPRTWRVFFLPRHLHAPPVSCAVRYVYRCQTAVPSVVESLLKAKAKAFRLAAIPAFRPMGRYTLRGSGLSACASAAFRSRVSESATVKRVEDKKCSGW
jgi:hypothetical protein